MVGVTQRVMQVHQPGKGYVNPTRMKISQYNDGNRICADWEFPQLIGLVVDYLTRYMLTTDVFKAFEVSIFGAKISGKIDEAEILLRDIRGLDAKSIEAAYELVQFDSMARTGCSDSTSTISKLKNEDIGEIRTMVGRSVDFFSNVEQYVDVGFTFEGGYTAVIDAGDGDYLTEGTIWDMKVSKNPPTKEQTLQLLIYYILGINSNQSKFQSVNRIGIFNPMMNRSYSIIVDSIDTDIIDRVKDEVVGIESVILEETTQCVRDYRYSENLEGSTKESLETQLMESLNRRYQSTMMPKAEYILGLDPESVIANYVMGVAELRRGNVTNACSFFHKSLDSGSLISNRIYEAMINEFVRYFISYCTDSQLRIDKSVYLISTTIKFDQQTELLEICQQILKHEFECKSAESVVRMAQALLIVFICGFEKSTCSGKFVDDLQVIISYISNLKKRIMSSKITSSKNISKHLRSIDHLVDISNQLLEGLKSNPIYNVDLNVIKSDLVSI